MLRYYLFVILAGPFLIALIALLAGGTGEALPMLTLSAYFVTAAAFLIDALVAILVRKLARGCATDPYARFYSVSKKEKKVHKFLRVRKWRDKIPEMGGLLVGFQKKKLEKDTPEYLLFFLKETCYAELMHLISAILGFAVVFLLPLRFALPVSLPVALVNFVLNMMPVLVQRYVRSHMIPLYERSKRRK